MGSRTRPRATRPATGASRGYAHIQRQLKWDGETGRLYFDLPRDNEVRKVRLVPEVRNRLAAHLARHPAATVVLPWQTPDGDPTTVELVVTNKRNNNPVQSGTLLTLYWWRAVCGRPATTRKAAEPGLGLPHQRAYGPHGLRHTFASVLLANGIPLSEVQRTLGHSTPIVTLRTYTHMIEQTDTPDGERILRGWSAIDDLLTGASAVAGETTAHHPTPALKVSGAADHLP